MVRLEAISCLSSGVAFLLLSCAGLTRASHLNGTLGSSPRVTVGRAVSGVTRCGRPRHTRSEEHTSELQSLMRSSYAVFCLKKKNKNQNNRYQHTYTIQRKH